MKRLLLDYFAKLGALRLMLVITGIIALNAAGGWHKNSMTSNPCCGCMRTWQRA